MPGDLRDQGVLRALGASVVNLAAAFDSHGNQCDDSRDLPSTNKENPVAVLADDFIRALQQLERTGDVAPLMALFREDAEVVNLGRTESMRGRDEIEGFWRDYRAMFRSIRSEFTHVIEGLTGSVLEWVSRGAKANGEPVEYKGVTVLEVEAGRIQRCRTYYDSAVLMSGGAATEGS